MRALTLWQPWAWAVFHGKNIESRGWVPTDDQLKQGDLLAIHAAARKPTKEHIETLRLQHGLSFPGEQAFGAVIGVVRYCGLLSPANVTCNWCEAHMFGWVLSDHQEISWPIKCRGHQGLWKLDAEDERWVREQISLREDTCA